jgi:hypothetical protein
VQLLDGATAEPVGLPLSTGTSALDLVTQLAFSADGHQLYARSFLGRWTVWPVGSEARAASELARQLARTSPDHEDQSVLRLPSAAERAALRARDHGWPTVDVRATPVAAGKALDGSPVPSRAATTPANLVALDPAYTNGPESVRNTFYSIQPSIRSMPAGVQRIGGVDFDIRGMAQIGILGYRIAQANGGEQRANDSGTQFTSVQCLATGDQPAAAVHLLLRPSVRAPIPSGQDVARLTLHYLDGTQAAVLLRAGLELPGYTGHDEYVPQTYATYVQFPLFGMDPELLSTPRLANPYPGRALHCVDFIATSRSATVLLLGMTLEPPATPAAATTLPTRSPP